MKWRVNETVVVLLLALVTVTTNAMDLENPKDLAEFSAAIEKRVQQSNDPALREAWEKQKKLGLMVDLMKTFSLSRTLQPTVEFCELRYATNSREMRMDFDSFLEQARAHIEEGQEIYDTGFDSVSSADLYLDRRTSSTR